MGHRVVVIRRRKQSTRKSSSESVDGETGLYCTLFAVLVFLDVIRVGMLSAANVFLFIWSSHPLLFLWIEFAEDVACALLSGLGTLISIPEREAAMGNAMTGKTR